MILHHPTTRNHHGVIEVSACLELCSPLPDLPGNLWYRLPEQYEQCVSQRADAFLPIALLMSMYAGEDLEVRGPVSFGKYRINWRRYYGASLIGAALLFSPLLERFYVPSGTPSYRTLGPAGVSPLSDHLLSTETLDIVHHGANIERTEKITAIAAWAPSHNLLRVCARKGLRDGVINCGECHKCVRTMISLFSGQCFRTSRT